MVSILIAVQLVLASASAADEVRTWTDNTGQEKVEASFIAADDTTAVLKDRDGKLSSVPLSHLSADDQAYIETRRQARTDAGGAETQVRSWTLNDGETVRGRVVDYYRRPIVLERSDDGFTIDGQSYASFQGEHQHLILKTLSDKTDRTFRSPFDVNRWLAEQPGGRLEVTGRGVYLQTPDDLKLAVPFALFGEADRQFLEPGYEQWLAGSSPPAAEGTGEPVAAPSEADQALSQQASLYLRARSQLEEKERKTNIVRNQLVIQSAFGISQWRVQLWPGPRTVVVPGRTSQDARRAAMARFPGARVGAIARISTPFNP
ncbi:MAG: SHD1 domain-containing protein [Planctomycetota bacterium]